MYLEENIKKLKEIGLSDEEIKKIKRSRWLIEYCRPTDLFLLKLAYMVKYRRFPAYETMEEGKEAISDFENELKHMIDVFSEKCEEAAQQYMQHHFEEFLFIPRHKLKSYHFKTLADFLLSLEKGEKILMSLSDFRALVFKKGNVFLHGIKMYECGTVWIFQLHTAD